MGRRSSAAKVAYPAVLGALSLLLLYVSAVFPTGSWGLVALAGLLPAGVVIAVGRAGGFVCWAGVTVLGFLLVPDKFCVLLYGVLFGLYPMVKAMIESLQRRPLEIVLKLVFFNIAFTLVYVVMKEAVLQSLPTVLGVVWALYLVGNVVFLLYDYGFSRVIALYVARTSHLRGR